MGKSNKGRNQVDRTIFCGEGGTQRFSFWRGRAGTTKALAESKIFRWGGGGTCNILLGAGGTQVQNFSVSTMRGRLSMLCICLFVGQVFQSILEYLTYPCPILSLRVRPASSPAVLAECSVFQM